MLCGSKNGSGRRVKSPGCAQTRPERRPERKTSMKIPSNRVQRNVSAKAMVDQCPKTAKVHCYPPTHKRVSAHIDFSPEEFALIKGGAKMIGESPREFLEDLVRAGVASAEDELAHAARPKLTDRENCRRIQGDEEWITIRLSPQIRRHLRAYGKNNFTAARGNLALISESVIRMAMLHREFIQNATDKFVRYAKAEGFENDQPRLFNSLLKAR